MRPTIATLTCLVALTACGGGGGSPTAGGTTSAPVTTQPPATPTGPPVTLSGKVEARGTAELGANGSLPLQLGDFFFAPTYVKVAGGTTVSVQLTNSGKAPHTFTIAVPKVDVTVQAGGQGVASFTMPDGALRFYCRFHAAQGMQGAFYVTEGATVSGGSGDDGAYGQ